MRYAFVEVLNIHNTMNLNNIQIRETATSDFSHIMEVEKLAFGYDKEAELVAAYFNEQQQQPMMHILAPLAVKPEYQRQGIGGMLIKAGIEKLQEKGSNLVFVLGHKEYYPKYGFIPDANHLGYPAPYPILEEYSDYWMVQPISPKGFEIGKGKIKCSEELNKPEHWRNEESDR